MKARYTCQIIPRTFRFRFDARTSRGPMPDRSIWLVKLTDLEHGTVGWGEAAPLPGLSQESYLEVEESLAIISNKIERCPDPIGAPEAWLHALGYLEWSSSVRMALETAVHDVFNGGRRKIFTSDFMDGVPIPINGLIWMGTKDWMWSQVQDKIKEGFTCIKLKVGGLDFESELEILSGIRKFDPGNSLLLRLDANGAFDPDKALDRLDLLAPFGIHSIEQPIRPGARAALSRICSQSPIPIALDEELIGIDRLDAKRELLVESGAQYLVLKPSLHGGFHGTREWIQVAGELGRGWWITSALESPVGLNAIAQFTALYKPDGFQGLGTGSIFEANILSPLVVKNGQISYEKAISWKI